MSTTTFTHDAKAIKRHSAQYDLFNRLHSIASDQAFVTKVGEEWYQGRFEVVREWYLRRMELVKVSESNSKPAVWELVLRSFSEKSFPSVYAAMSE